MQGEKFMQLNGPTDIGIRHFHSVELIESRKHTDIWGTNDITVSHYNPLSQVSFKRPFISQLPLR
jgi:hypothetical protein